MGTETRPGLKGCVPDELDQSTWACYRRETMNQNAATNLRAENLLAIIPAIIVGISSRRGRNMV
jgi:hypothetical protein